MLDDRYRSGRDFTLEYLGHRYAFSRVDLEERLAVAARRLGLVGRRALDGAERADLVDLAVCGAIEEPRSGLGRSLVDDGGRLLVHGGADLVHWLRKLVFRSAWRDHRIKVGLIEARYDEATGGFRYEAEGLPLPPDDDADLPVWPAVPRGA